MKESEPKKIAKILFVEVGLSQSEIAERLGKDKSQISRWANEDNWKTLRSAKTATAEKIVQRTYAQINNIYDGVENEGRVITAGECDQICKLMVSIKTLNKGADLATFIQAYEEFIKYLNEQDPKLAKIVADYQMDYLTLKAFQLSKE
jgi:transcriptional regulator with XRE-family HTH domain